MPQRPPGFLMALWLAFVRFITSLFTKSPSAAPLPIPVTARPSNAKPNTPRPTSVSVGTTHQRISLPPSAWVTEPSPLKRTTTSAASSPFSSTARTSPACRSRSATPKCAPEYIFHPPASPFPNISLSGIFATPPLLASPRLGHLSLTSPPDALTMTPVVSPGSPSPFRGSHGVPSPSFHTLHSRSPRTPRTPSPAVMVQLDRSAISPTTMSDGSLEVISLGDPHGFVGPPIKVADIGRLPSPWSPVGKTARSDVWMSVGGMLMNATGPVVDNPAPFQDDSVAPRTAMFSVSRISASSLYSSPSALDAFGISVFVSLDEVDDSIDTKDDPSSVPKLSQVREENRPMLVTPRKRRDTHPSVTSHTPSNSARSAKCLSTPLTKLDHVGVSHVRSATSISSMAYELRMGLFADGRSMSAFENIISLLDQASPESIRTTPHHDAMQPVVVS